MLEQEPELELELEPEPGLEQEPEFETEQLPALPQQLPKLDPDPCLPPELAGAEQRPVQVAEEERQQEPARYPTQMLGQILPVRYPSVQPRQARAQEQQEQAQGQAREQEREQEQEREREQGQARTR